MDELMRFYENKNLQTRGYPDSAVPIPNSSDVNWRVTGHDEIQIRQTVRIRSFGDHRFFVETGEDWEYVVIGNRKPDWSFSKIFETGWAANRVLMDY